MAALAYLVVVALLAAAATATTNNPSSVNISAILNKFQDGYDRRVSYRRAENNLK